MEFTSETVAKLSAECGMVLANAGQAVSGCGMALSAAKKEYNSEHLNEAVDALRVAAPALRDACAALARACLTVGDDGSDERAAMLELVNAAMSGDLTSLEGMSDELRGRLPADLVDRLNKGD